MARLDELPPELVLHIVSFLTREMIITKPFYFSRLKRKYIVPDLPSVNALSRTSSVFHHTLNHNLYQLCATVERLGRLSLLFAVEHNLEDAFDKLVAAGVSVDGNFQSRLPLTPPGPYSLLQIAAGKGSSLIVPKLLRMYGTETLERVHARDGSGLSALDYAVLQGRLETVRVLVPMAILAPSSSSPITIDLSDERIQAHKEYLGKALIKSTFRGPSGEKIAICEYLLSEGADINTLDTNMHSALGHATDCDNFATMQILLAAGADPNLDGDGVVPLFRARNVPAVQVLLDAGAHIHATDNAGRNALAHRALERVEVLRVLLEHGVDPNHPDHSGWTPLHYACEKGAPVAVIELLLQFGAATVEKADADGVTPADLAMKRGMIEVVRLFEPLIQDPALKAKISKWLKEKGELGDTGSTF
ncbi:Serine/threonine-protein phosphatase 6 regulatory ankyrin repeat subunit A-like protein [Mycena sanguinolenta]|uniref:Serine/threonine-protein phosphatase 6 regulatory ankyrin repeat subunit A-like protein n=1 Tax=Mycena sanguinolenta TaxID=230812 RepID=A0A8H6YZ20_9AGAR|nr:Serine/threonine-protein phosphatase 6 regulatory ankyrin repeat subunit A-like protein [Mycena sanguinolenta]